jgi:hypothetical protein
MSVKRMIFGYLAGYLIFTGIGLITVPHTFFTVLLQSNQTYTTSSLQFAGMFALALGILFAVITYFNDVSKYFVTSMLVRTGIVAFLVFLYSSSGDPAFLFILPIVLLGLIPAYIVVINEKMAGSRMR